MEFPTRLHQFRRARRMTQQALAELSQIHVNQIKRYEAGTAQPTLEVLVRVAKVLHVGLDELVFAQAGRGPSAELALQFDEVAQMPEDEQRIVKALLEGMILRYQANRLVTDERKEDDNPD